MGIRITLLCAYSILLIFTMFIFFKYTVPLKRNYPQILSFYILNIVNQITCITVLAYLCAIGGEEHNMMYHNVQSGVSIAFNCSRTLDYCVYLLLTLTMFHLYLGLAFVNRKYKSMREVHCIKDKAAILFFTMCIISVLILIPSFIKRHWAQ